MISVAVDFVNAANTFDDPVSSANPPDAVGVPKFAPLVPAATPMIIESAAGLNPVDAAHWWLVVDAESSKKLVPPTANVPESGVTSQICHVPEVVPPLTLNVTVTLPPVVHTQADTAARAAFVPALSA